MKTSFREFINSSSVNNSSVPWFQATNKIGDRLVAPMGGKEEAHNHREGGQRETA
jgi:hypothetical protein